jgi:hypothetical protein
MHVRRDCRARYAAFATAPPFGRKVSLAKALQR